MSIRSKILATVAGVAALCAAIVATPTQTSQAHAETTSLLTALVSHGY